LQDFHLSLYAGQTVALVGKVAQASLSAVWQFWVCCPIICRLRGRFGCMDMKFSVCPKPSCRHCVGIRLP
jgi:hypothetical protein